MCTAPIGLNQSSNLTEYYLYSEKAGVRDAEKISSITTLPSSSANNFTRGGVSPTMARETNIGNIDGNDDQLM